MPASGGPTSASPDGAGSGSRSPSQPRLVLAEARRAALDACRGRAHLHQRAELAHRAEVVVGDVDHTVVGEHVGVGQELGRRQERVGADVEILDEHPHPLRLCAGAHAGAQARLELVDVGDGRDPHRRSGVARFGERLLQADGPQPVLEVAILPRAHLDVPAVGALGGQEAELDATMCGRRDGRRRLAVLAAPELLAHDERRRTLQHARRHVLAAAGRGPLQERGDDALHRQLRCAERGDGRGGERRFVVAHARLPAAQLVEPGHAPGGRGEDPFVGLRRARLSQRTEARQGTRHQRRVHRLDRRSGPAPGGATRLARRRR